MHEYLVSIREEERAQKGPAAQSESYDWLSQSARCRCFYVVEGQQAQGDLLPGEDPEVRQKRQRGYSPEQLEKTIESGGKLNVDEMLMCRLRFATAGVIFGAKEFVEEGFKAMKKNARAIREPQRWGQEDALHQRQTDLRPSPAPKGCLPSGRATDAE